MPYILWVEENGKPRILRIVDEVVAETDMVHHHTPEQFEKVVGPKSAKAALARYHKDQAKRAAKDDHGHAGDA